ncbi:U-box domain-containing protein 35-like isoform X2 [Primulina huaijiensis]|uniref:U-box domain-containing protein 35-like isoform X2 n=1 Tax=Primulina huaijiensis TaxID=1492673 RepID=UPI003CC784EC
MQPYNMANHEPTTNDYINIAHEGNISTAVAVDRNKNSQHAVKWAVDNLNLKDNRIILLHVLCTQPFLFPLELTPKEGRAPTQPEMQQLFLPYRGFCARKAIRVKEVILHGHDIAKTLCEYVDANSITTIILGASTRNAISRAFRNADVPSCVAKHAPDSCSVYAVPKGGKALEIKSAIEPGTPLFPEFLGCRTEAESSLDVLNRQRPVDIIKNICPLNSPNNFMEYQQTAPWNRPFLTSKTPSPQSSLSSNELQQMIQWESHYESNLPLVNSAYSSYNCTPFGSNNVSPLASMGSNGTEFGINQLAGGKISGPENGLRTQTYDNSINFTSGSSDQSEAHSFNSDVSVEFLDNSRESHSSKSSSSSQAAEVEDELRRLKLELKHVTEKYNAACIEAATANEKVREIDRWKTEETRKSEDAKHAQESAFAIVEREKKKYKAAVLVATKAQRIAELESERRRQAEMKFKHEADEKQKAMDALACNIIKYRQYSINEIEAATNYFSDSDKIGEGGYGPVYKAFLDHTPVAIKILRPDFSQGQRQFQREVEVLSRIRHPHMVILLGACPENGCLVYEYMDNGSLEDRLYRKNGTPPLSWRARFRIAAEIAIALNFLHQTRPEPLVHRDLKPANILLDNHYVSKISDVGLARLVPPPTSDTITEYRMTSAAGTFCYIDPEYQQTGMLGTKSDIYSLGILLMQIITAKPPMGLTHQVENAIETRKFDKILDPTVKDWPMEEALSFAELALKCCELRRRDRPALDSVILPELERLRDLGSNMGGIFTYNDS